MIPEVGYYARVIEEPEKAGVLHQRGDRYYLVPRYTSIAMRKKLATALFHLDELEPCDPPERPMTPELRALVPSMVDMLIGGHRGQDG